MPRTWKNRHGASSRQRLLDRPATPVAGPVPSSSTENDTNVNNGEVSPSAKAKATSDYEASLKRVGNPIPHHWRVETPQTQVTREMLELRQNIAESIRHGDVFNAREGWFDPDAPEDVLRDWRLQHKALVEDHQADSVDRGRPRTKSRRPPQR